MAGQTVPTNLPKLRAALNGAFARLDRADRQLRSLDTALRRFRNRKPYRHTCRGLQPTGGDAVLFDYGSFAKVMPVFEYHDMEVGLEEVVVPPLIEWGVRVGEVVQHLSSALDYLVWELSQDHLRRRQERQPGLTAERVEQWKRQVNFPVCVTRKQWNDRKHALGFVDRPARDLIELMQPFNDADPEGHPLAVLNALWNDFKHRSVPVQAFAASLRSATASFVEVDPAKQQPVEVVTRYDPRPLVGLTQLGVVRVPFPVLLPVGAPTTFVVNVHFNFDLSLLFGEGTPCPRQPVVPWATEVGREIDRLLALFR